jgi:hypothetical protein
MPQDTKSSRSRPDTSLVSGQITDQGILSERTPPDKQASPNSESHVQTNTNKQSLLTILLNSSVRLEQGLSDPSSRSSRTKGKVKRPANNPDGRKGNKLCAQCEKAKKGVSLSS